MLGNGLKSRISKHKKKSWRKVDLTEINQFLEDKELDERTDRTEKPIFTIETERSLENLNLFQLNNNTCENFLSNLSEKKVETCYKHLQSTSAVLPFKSNKSNHPKLPVLLHIKNSKILDHLSERLKNRKTRKERFSKDKNELVDIWDKKNSISNDYDNLEKVKLSLTNKYIPKKNLKKSPKCSLLPHVENPHPGLSYNPNSTDHEQLLISIGERKKKLIKEKKRLNKSLKCNVDYSINLEEEHKKELLSGLFSEEEEENDTFEQNKDDNFSSENCINLNKLKNGKSKKQIRHELRTKIAKLISKKRKEEKVKLNEVTKINKYIKEIKKAELKRKLNKEIREKKKIEKLYKPAKLGKQKYIEPEPDFCLPEELNQSLRKINTDGNILLDRFKFFQKRNIIEHRRVLLLPKAKAKRKKVIRASIYNKDLFESNDDKDNL